VVVCVVESNVYNHIDSSSQKHNLNAHQRKEREKKDRTMTDRRQQNSVQNEISNKIKISIRRPVFRFVDDAVQSLKQYQEIELSGLGLGKLFIFKYAFCVSTIKISSKLHIKKKLFTFCSKRRRIQNLF
jgi:hypothetical protein